MNRRYFRFLLITGSLLVLISNTSCFDRQGAPAPVYSMRSRVDNVSSAGSVAVRTDDTLWNISKRYRLPLRGIIDLNGLQPPYALHEGQRLRLPAPAEHRVGAADTLTGIASMYGVSISSLVKINQIPYPYSLREGQVLRMPYADHASRASPKSEKTPVTKIDTRRQAASGVSVPVQKLESPRPADNVVSKWAQTPISGSTHPMPSMPSEPLTAAPYQRNNMTPTQVLTAGAGGKFIWPLRGKIISGYGPKEGGLYNDGVNIAAPAGTPVQASAEGVVAYVGNGLSSYGNLVLIRHGSGVVTAYAHLSGVNVRQGTPVKKGQTIGAVGTTGAVSSPQLHFEVRQQSDTLDPVKFLR